MYTLNVKNRVFQSATFEGEFCGVIFIPSDSEEDKIKISSLKLKNEKSPTFYPPNSLGFVYNILVYKYKDEKIYNLDKFESTLVCPSTYICHLIKCEMYGVLVRKTLSGSSDNFIESLYTNFLKNKRFLS